MKILVTGGCGFIGSNLIPRLIQAGHKVRVLDNFSVGQPAVLEQCDVDIVQGDIRDVDVVKRETVGVDAIVHLAAQTGVVPSQQDPRLDFEVNAEGTLNLLMASREAAIKRFVFISSSAPLGNVDPPITEEISPKPIAPYGASKLAGEGYCSAFYGSYGLPTFVLRLANVYGPGSYGKQSAVARFMKEGLSEKRLTIYGDGLQTRDFVYVDDVCSAIRCAMDIQDAKGQTVHIASGVETRILDLAHMVCKELGFSPDCVHHMPARSGEIYRIFICIDQAKRLLGWSPLTTLFQGIFRTGEWFSRQK